MKNRSSSARTVAGVVAMAVLGIGVIAPAHAATTLPASRPVALASPGTASKLVVKKTVKKQPVRKAIKKKAKPAAAVKKTIAVASAHRELPKAAPSLPVTLVESPLELDGDEALEIANVHYILKGPIILRDRARLVIKDAIFEQRGGGLDARDAAAVKIEHSELHFDPGTSWKFADHSSLQVRHIEPGSDSAAYYEFAGNAEGDFVQAPFMGKISELAQLAIVKSPNVMIDLDLNGGAIVDEAFPRHVTEYNFPNGDGNISYRLHIVNSTVTHWGVILHPTSDVTVRDTDNLKVSMLIRSPWTNFSAILSDLRPEWYDYKVVRLSQTTDRFWDRYLRLILLNTSVQSWEPIVGDDNTLVIKNSTVLPQAWSWGNAKIILENSVTPELRAQDNVEIIAKNSTINGDVRALENGKITLSDSAVLGLKLTQDQGTIVTQ